MGNALLQLFDNGKPVLATDPWLKGTCYFGSWALDHALTESQIQNVIRSPFIWISHGHPDHLHLDSLQLFPRDKRPRILIPDHYASEIREFLEGEGFPVQVLKFKKWTDLTPGLRVMCMENMNQDAMLLIEAGDALVINKNDAPLYGEENFLKNLVSRYSKSYLLALCAMDADMLNYIDENGNPLLPDVDEAKAAVIRLTSQLSTFLKVKHFCCFSSQHVYIRQDSIWANPYRVTYADMKKYWDSPAILIEPFVTVNLESGAVTANYPSHQTDMSQITDGTGDDDWAQPMSPEDWRQLEAFVRKFKILESEVDFIRFTVAGESRTFEMKTAGATPSKPRGVNFIVPRNSLMETVKYGYFDDLLIGNFMKTQLINMKLYPKFSPYLAKFGGSAKVYTRLQLMQFFFHYFKLSPVSYVRSRVESFWVYTLRNRLRNILVDVGLLKVVKRMAGPRPS